MKILHDILFNTDAKVQHGSDEITVSGMTSSSRDVQKGFVFFALKGVKTDGHKFISDAVQAGAAAVVCDNLPEDIHADVTYIVTQNGNETYAQAAANWYDNPSEELDLIGVTGTNGKTTTATLLFELFNKMNHLSGLISTIRYVVPGMEYPATHTTPDALVLNRMLREMADAGCAYCFMEVSSHAVVQGRVHGLVFHGGIFSNLTHDHLDYHGTFAEYLRAKQLFFDHLPAHAFALYNDDDANGKVMVQHTKAKKYSYALNRPADFKTKILQNAITGLGLNLDGTEAWFRLVGRFNAYNLTAIYAAAVLCGMDKKEVLVNLSALEEVNGRFNVIRSESGITGVVDYAHTPDALKNVLSTLEEVNEGNGQIITVAGAGGDRDKTKRPLMGQMMARFSQKVIITSDNPRTEDPDTIIQEVKSGIDAADMGKVLCITDRREAIKTACMLANPGDIILVAGKGHETYQEINGVRNHFNDTEQLNEFLKH